jgi:hypothetical protein
MSTKNSIRHDIDERQKSGDVVYLEYATLATDLRYLCPSLAEPRSETWIQMMNLGVGDGNETSLVLGIWTVWH